MTRHPDVLVLDAHTRGSLAITRALGRAGQSIAAAGPVGSMSFRSRYLEWECVLENPDHASIDGYRDALLSWVQRHRPSVVLTSTDGGVVALDSLRERIPTDVILAIPARKALAATTDKETTLAAAARVGLTVPRGIAVRCLDEALAAADTLGYPVVLKPTNSWRATTEGTSTQHIGERVVAALIHDRAGLAAAVNRLVRSDAPALVQEYATGGRLAISLVRGGGETWGAVAVRADRCWPALGGNSVMRQSIAVPAELLSGSEALLDELGYEGYAEVEFRESADGRPLVMEINPRFSQSVDVAVRSGINLPGLHVAFSRGDNPPGSRANYNPGRRLSWFRGELNILVAAFRDGEPPQPKAGPAIRALLRDMVPPPRFDVASWSDPMPMFGSVGRLTWRKSPQPVIMDSVQPAAEVITTLARLREIAPQWAVLVDASGTRNPYARPEWLLTWAEQFLTHRKIRVVALWKGEALVALAPYYLKPWPSGFKSLQLFGTAMHVDLTELPQIVCMPGAARAALRDVFLSLQEIAADWDWMEMPVAADQGWFEPGWLSGDGDFVLHKTTRATVTLPLAADWTTFLAGLKRNVRESVRRGYNRLDKLTQEQGLEWSVKVLDKDSPDLRAGLGELIRLHSSRASVSDRVQHADAFTDPADCRFLLACAPKMAAAGHLSLLLLSIGEETAAAQLVLHAADGIYFSVSGLDSQWWDYSPVTVLKSEAMRLAIDRGLAVANLSAGPDTAKLRWSESLDLHQEFIVVGGRRRSQLAFAVFWQTSNIARLWREYRRHGQRTRAARDVGRVGRTG